MELQVGPRTQEGGQVDEGVETQSIIAIVRQVGHEYTDLGRTNKDEGKEEKGKERRKGNKHLLCCGKL